MAETVFLKYPCPASSKTLPTNNFDQKKRPGGGTYKRPVGHGGSDIASSKRGKVGDPVFPVRGGRVVWVGTLTESNKWGADYGNRVLVKHVFTHKGKPFTRYSFYAHLDEVSVEKGRKVSISDQIGTMGKTGHTTGPHVHFEWHSSPEWRKGVRDPFPLLDEIRRKELGQ